MKILVDDQWLASCGMSRYCGVPMEVTRKTPMWPNDEAMYHVTLPEGQEWCVWSIRGVTEINDPEPVAAAPEPVIEAVVPKELPAKRKGKKPQFVGPYHG